MIEINKKDFGNGFTWGVSQSAFQTEGFVDVDGKSASNWDVFSQKINAIKSGETAINACEFYKKYKSDILISKDLGFNNFGHSLAWTRILPNGIGQVNQKGIDYYNKLIDYQLEQSITPWLTIYHWDLPHILEQKGGWANRDILHWFGEYTDIVTRAFGDRVKNWKVINEPSAFCGFGYMTGEHAPGKKNIFKFLAASHHANLCQGIAGRIANKNVKNGHIGTSFATFYLEPKNQNYFHRQATKRIDATINRMYIEPIVGLGYPYQAFPALRIIEKYIKTEDDKMIKHDFDFIGIQYYCRLIGKFSLLPLIAFANEVPAKNRNVPTNNMGFEIYPEGLYHVLKQYAEYPNVKKLLVTENGVCLDDKIENQQVNDPIRIQFYKDYLAQLARAKNEGVAIEGFFCWTLTDNFEWWEGFKARFGLVYVDHHTQNRIVKNSGHWFKKFLKS